MHRVHCHEQDGDSVTTRARSATCSRAYRSHYHRRSCSLGRLDMASDGNHLIIAAVAGRRTLPGTVERHAGPVREGGGESSGGRAAQA